MLEDEAERRQASYLRREDRLLADTQDLERRLAQLQGLDGASAAGGAEGAAKGTGEGGGASLTMQCVPAAEGSAKFAGLPFLCMPAQRI